jgi:histidyl-tRNA synthetase
MQDDPLPLRLHYSGPVFRYEKPQQNRYRQFTMVGAEMLGAEGTIADAEMLHLACAGLEKLGITRYKLTIGHTEILEGFLHKLGLRTQLLNFLLRNMENIRKRGMPFVIDRLREIFPELEFTADDLKQTPQEEAKGQNLINVLREMSNEEAHEAITEFLHNLNIHIDTNRDEQDVIDRLLHKIREDEQGPKLHMALDYMQKLSELVGTPDVILSQARELVTQYDVNPAALAEIEQLLEVFAWHGDIQGNIELDFGLNRGLHYYTGLMFEIHYPSDGEEDIQLCGGGRYDNLITVLGGNPTPALGFAYGVERIASILADNDSINANNSPDVYIIPLQPADYAYSFEVAQTLRASNHIVEMSIDSRNLKKSLKHADKRKAHIVVIIGETERTSRQVVIRDMHNHDEQAISFDDIQHVVEGLLADHVQHDIN